MATVIATGPRTDEQIQRDVLAELAWEPRVQPNEIGVAVKDGVVTLTGWVDSYTKKWAAEEATHRVRGVLAVANDIEVQITVKPRLTPSRLKEKIDEALLRSAKTDAERITVEVQGGEGDPEGDGAGAGREGRSGAGGVVRPRGDLGGEPDHHLALAATRRARETWH